MKKHVAYMKNLVCHIHVFDPFFINENLLKLHVYRLHMNFIYVYSHIVLPLVSVHRLNLSFVLEVYCIQIMSIISMTKINSSNSYNLIRT